MTRNISELKLHPCPKRKVEIQILRNINNRYVGSNGLPLSEDQYQSYLFTLEEKGFITSLTHGTDGLEEVCFPEITLSGQEYLFYYSKPWVIRQFMESDWKYMITLIISIIAILVAFLKG